MNSTRLWLPAIFTLTICAVSALLDPAMFSQSWLAAIVCCMALPLGALPILMTHSLTGGRWGESSRHVWRGFAATLPLLLLALLVLALVSLVGGGTEVFAWRGAAATLPEAVQRKQLYLNTPFLVVRLLGYIALWFLFAWWQGVWSTKRCALLSAPCLFFWLLSLTFFSVDWLMSLEPLFYSDVYGWQLSVGMICAAMAAGLLLAGASLPTSVRRDLANLWLALLLGWAFIAFAQFIIIWSGNLPDEIGWYLARNESPWRLLGWLSFGLFFAVPTAVLMSGEAKQRQHWMSLASATCLTGWILWVHWLVLPAFAEVTLLQYGLSLLLTLGLGASFVSAVAFSLRNAAPVRRAEGKYR